MTDQPTAKEQTAGTRSHVSQEDSQTVTASTNGKKTSQTRPSIRRGRSRMVSCNSRSLGSEKRSKPKKVTQPPAMRANQIQSPSERRVVGTLDCVRTSLIERSFPPSRRPVVHSDPTSDAPRVPSGREGAPRIHRQRSRGRRLRVSRRSSRQLASRGLQLASVPSEHARERNVEEPRRKRRRLHPADVADHGNLNDDPHDEQGTGCAGKRRRGAGTRENHRGRHDHDAHSDQEQDPRNRVVVERGSFQPFTWDISSSPECVETASDRVQGGENLEPHK